MQSGAGLNRPEYVDLAYAPDGTAVRPHELLPLGYDRDHIEAVAQVAAAYEGTVVLKPAPADAALHKFDTPISKPGLIPTRSYDPQDAMVGLGGPDRQGYVQHALPERPVAPPGLSGDDLSQYVRSTNSLYERRVAQYHTNTRAMETARTQGAVFKIAGQDVVLGVSWEGAGRWVNPATGAEAPFADGVVCAVVPEGAPEVVQERLGPPGTKVPVAAGAEAYTFVSNHRIASNGSIQPLSVFPPQQAAAIQAQEAAAQQALQQSVPGIAHEGDAPNWNPPTLKQAAVCWPCVMSQFSAGNDAAQNLIWVNSNSTASVGRWPGSVGGGPPPAGYETPAPPPAPGAEAPAGYQTPAPPPAPGAAAPAGYQTPAPPPAPGAEAPAGYETPAPAPPDGNAPPPSQST